MIAVIVLSLICTENAVLMMSTSPRPVKLCSDHLFRTRVYI